MKKNLILFVDDEPSFLDGLRRTLHPKRNEWDMMFALSVDEAMAKTSETMFDAIITDVDMPGKNGLALLKELRALESTRDIPVVILTGKADMHLKSLALDLGATDLLNKPVQREDLIARIKSVLRLKSYQDEIKAQNEILDRKVRERTQELEDSQFEIVMRLAKASEFRDEETGNHVIRVGCYSHLLAKELCMDPQSVEMILLAAPLHDIGKIGIPDLILLKPGKLTPEEMESMKNHCSIGYEMLVQDPKAMDPLFEWQNSQSTFKRKRTGNPIIKMASIIALGHHEKWDGSGYPLGLSGDAIPLEARIVALADVYDALGSNRPYKKAFSEEKALAIIREETGAHFDPTICSAFERLISDFRMIRAQFSDKSLTL